MPINTRTYILLLALMCCTAVAAQTSSDTTLVNL